MPFADFHVHGNFKAFFTGYTVAEKKSPWEEVKIGIDNFLFKKTNRVLSSQSCFRQLYDGDMRLGVIPLYSTEHAFPDSFLLKVVDFFSGKISNQLFRDIRKNKISYWQQLDDCYRHLLRARTDNVPGHEIVNFTHTIEDFKAGAMNIVLSMEGAHCFLDSADDAVTPAGMSKIAERILRYKQRNPADNHPRVFILNLTHLTQAPFCNHAFGMKLISHPEFIPQGRAISPAGYKVIETALGYDKDHFPMLVDVKHMSVESRRDFYSFRRKYFPDIPVTASHAGCTGISLEQVNDYIEEINAPVFNKRKCNLISYRKPVGILPGTTFNPWSINLYDEDIVEILSSDGIIGLSLDQRILGCGDIAREKMSKSETFTGIMPDRPLLGRDPEEGPLVKDPELHFRHFCNNIFHIVKIAGRIISPVVDPWKKIVIGSDFDGLIDAVDFCTDAREYRNIAVYMQDKLPELAAEAGITLPADPETLINGILFNNAQAFLGKYYSRNSFPA
jgi:microsomal dipeptidase-like Zn-dependent dipeptidase